MTTASALAKAERGSKAAFAVAAIAAAIGVFGFPLGAAGSGRTAAGNICDSAGVSAAVAGTIFGAGSALGIVTGAGPAFCTITPATNPGSGYIEIIKKPKSAFGSLVGHYSYQGTKSPLAGLGGGAVWYHQGATAESVIFTAGANAFAIAVNISAQPFPTRAKLTALASAIRSHFA